MERFGHLRVEEFGTDQKFKLKLTLLGGFFSYYIFFA